jgi:hypothetical protein
MVERRAWARVGGAPRTNIRSCWEIRHLLERRATPSLALQVNNGSVEAPKLVSKGYEYVLSMGIQVPLEIEG